jgi:hypothetical protein
MFFSTKLSILSGVGYTKMSDNKPLHLLNKKIITQYHSILQTNFVSTLLQIGFKIVNPEISDNLRNE